MKTMTLWTASLMVAVGLASKAAAQLAVTEVMARTSTYLATGFVGPDFWELTNFGTHDLDLDGYGMSDNAINVIFRDPFVGLTLHAGKTVIFCESNRWVNTPDQFRSWWGNDRLPAQLQVRFYTVPGLSAAGDQLWVWDRNGGVVDRVSFGRSLPGRSWSYESSLGTFGVQSQPEVHGAFRAAASPDDVGSPGTTLGPVGLKLLIQPTSQTADGCGSVTFSALAVGIPRSQYQWTSNAVPIAGATGETLILPEVGPSAAAEYRVIVSNGIEELLSERAWLSVSTEPAAPGITHPPQDLSAFPGQTARFSIEARGFPCVQYQWYSNQVALPEETQRTLSVPIADREPPGETIYSVTVWNDQGTASASARLTIVPRPRLQITEIMTRPGTNELALDQEDWFELTNADTFPVNLQGYRFRDTDLYEVAFVITNAIVIQPGESIIFVKSLSRDEFVRWWGADRLPPAVQVVTWEGWGVGVANSVYLWNASPSATEGSLDTVATAAPLGSWVGLSEELENDCSIPLLGCMAFFLRDSVEGERGAFKAALGTDIGSPGYTANPLPRCLSVERVNGSVILRWRVTAGRTYRLHSKDTLHDGDWTPREMKLAEDYVLPWTEVAPSETPTRYYRLEELP